MIRKNLLLCKIFRIKTSSKSLFDSYMAKFQPHLETCPLCGSTGNCHIHDYYDRSLVDFRSGIRTRYSLCVMRVFCDSCEHAHAILPDVMIPYSSFSLLFILRLLGQYFSDRPCLIWFVYDGITKQIWAYLSLLHTLGKIHFRIDGVNIHFVHVTSCFPASHMITFRL